MPVLKSWLAWMLIPLWLTGCSPADNQTRSPAGPEPIAAGDECHLCGMAIQRFPGPKGEVADQQGQVHKFCSTRDLLAWMLQPENRNQVAAFYVHDMARTDWNRPDDAHLIDGRTAWYVAGSDRKGAMGPTLASFGDESAARTFARQHGGQVMRFGDITLHTLNTLTDASHQPGDMGGMAH
ncbi:nitrous oxide reductase accessory protein NosL [Hahella sp. SMD15-11]|uniref:Nitrous oxide reductase accessory protein NosL n=1 Tax=Thermohahella caldifontis TaxID=3142973 RepID=A0AB39US98_9GAMM